MSGTETHTDHAVDPACAVAHGDQPPDTGPRALVAVFESPVAEYLLRFGIEVGYRTTLVEPDPSRLTGRLRAHGDRLAEVLDKSVVDRHTDIIVTDHDRPELGRVLRDALRLPARWVGVIGSVRHTAPHIEALEQLGVAREDIVRVHRPVGLNIGSKSPAEIALSTLAGLIADRNRRPGGFSF
jgi:xanthine/CO dehydrogenase XdhC/CoxF family maturation factor